MPRAAFLRARPPPCVMRPQKRYPKWKKRRLYDVMSICQCLRVVERSCKSQFIWRGIRRVQSAVYEFLLRDMAVRPILDGHTELDPDEPAVPVTGLAFLCQQFVLLLRQRALDRQEAAISLEDATQQLCERDKSTDDKTVRPPTRPPLGQHPDPADPERAPHAQPGPDLRGRGARPDAPSRAPSSKIFSMYSYYRSIG